MNNTTTNQSCREDLPSQQLLNYNKDNEASNPENSQPENLVGEIAWFAGLCGYEVRRKIPAPGATAGCPKTRKASPAHDAWKQYSRQATLVMVIKNTPVYIVTAGADSTSPEENTSFARQVYCNGNIYLRVESFDSFLNWYFLLNLPQQGISD